MEAQSLEQIERILNNTYNINMDFVVHVKSQDELNDLIGVKVRFVFGKFG